MNDLNLNNGGGGDGGGGGGGGSSGFSQDVLTAIINLNGGGLLA